MRCLRCELGQLSGNCSCALRLVVLPPSFYVVDTILSLFPSSIADCLFIRLSAWEEELKVELDKRNADWNPLEDGSYVDITPEDRVRAFRHFMPKFYFRYISPSKFLELFIVNQFKEQRFMRSQNQYNIRIL